jgi:hypothetical protein
MTSGRSALMIVALGAALFPGPALGAENRREVEGRALFARGDYQNALNVFAALFAEVGDPVYLRNIGRCHQMLRQPDKAIDAFREYLRRGRRIKAQEREEITGFIREMQALRTETGARPSAEPGAVGLQPAPLEHEAPRLSLASPAPPAPGSMTAAATVTDRPESSGPGITSRWWFWAGIGAVVAGGVVAALALKGSSGGGRPACPSGFTCP